MGLVDMKIASQNVMLGKTFVSQCIRISCISTYGITVVISRIRARWNGFLMLPELETGRVND